MESFLFCDISYIVQKFNLKLNVVFQSFFFSIWYRLFSIEHKCSTFLELCNLKICLLCSKLRECF